MACNTAPGPKQQPLRITFELLTHLHQLAGLAVPHRHDEVGVDEEQDLAELDDLYRVDVPGRLGDPEQGLAIGLQLGPLTGVDGVLHRQRVEIEGLTRRFELVLGRLIEAQPTPRSPGRRGDAQLPRNRRDRSRVGRFCRWRRRRSCGQATPRLAPGRSVPGDVSSPRRRSALPGPSWPGPRCRPCI